MSDKLDLDYPLGHIWEPVPDRFCVLCTAMRPDKASPQLERLMEHHGGGFGRGPLEVRCPNCRMLYSVHD